MLRLDKKRSVIELSSLSCLVQSWGLETRLKALDLILELKVGVWNW